MRCQDVERLILDEGTLGPEERAKVDAHLADCARCSEWREFSAGLQERVSKMPRPKLSAGLAEKVRLAAQAELARRSGGDLRALVDARPSVPGFIWAALAAITVLTLAFFIPGVQDFAENQKLTLGTALALVLIAQNTLTLLFAPVVLRRERHSQGG